MVLVPMLWICFWKERWKPLISATMPITVPTPMTIPSRARNERSRFATSAWRAIRKVSRSRSKVIASLVAQRLDRIEARRPRGRIRAEEDAHQARHQDPEQDRREVDRRQQRRDRPHQ